ncbi:DEAD/DEAH box helicase [Serinicoccus kebangsaanensis]|uniref:DEAD/DEAH box helicase n=1 Tax=Serinicoccus kebangsaanensis TaxID=2602069 RepID=UPI00124C3E25|nr:DEAD/DEAH box helicase [Serinicoccus kebangsaanensis]
MPPDLAAADWVLRVEDGALRADVGELTFARAQGYAEAGHVRTLVTGPDGAALVGTVTGGRGHVYQTVVRIHDREVLVWSGQCSCPVGQDCKHAVAVLITARSRLRSRSGAADWESVLAPLVRPAQQLGRQPHRLGLQVSVSRGPGGRDERTRVALRPVRPGRSKPWVGQGVGWDDLTNRWSTTEVDPRHRSLLGQLAALGKSSGFGYFYSSAKELPLGEIGAVAWPVLRQVVDAGVPLVAGEDVTSVALGEGQAQVGLDLTREEDGQLALRAGVRADGLPASPTGVFLVGRPPHGLGRVDEGGELTLWPLGGAVPEVVVGLVESGRVMRVPPEDVGRFLTQYYPALARQVRLTSSDGSVVTPADAPPRLRLEITPEPGHVLHLRWTFGYALPTVDGEPQLATVGLSAGPDDPPRDADAERRATGAVLPLLEGIPACVAREPHGGEALRPRCVLTGLQTARFVEEVLPVLQDCDDVDVVLHGDLATYEEAAQSPVVHLTTSEAQEGDWLDLHVSVTVGDVEIPFELLFEALARGEEVLLLDSGLWLRLDQPELLSLRRLIEEARELVDSDAADDPAQLRLTPYQAGLWEELVELGVVHDQHGRWRERVDALLALGEGDRGVVPAPPALEATLRPYQLDGFRWLAGLWDAGLGGILADDMGLGKTLQALAMVVRAEDRADLAEGPVLVVAPTSVVGAWAEQAARFAPHLATATITSTGRRRGTDLATAIGAADLVITSYTLLRMDAPEYHSMPWSGVVLDEAQVVKNRRSATYQAVRRLDVGRTFAMTGTPLENTLMDLWSMTSLAAPGLFPRPEVFTERYRKPIEAGSAPLELDRLRARIRPFMLRRTKAEVAADLPDKIEQTLTIDLHPAHRRVYDQHLQRERQRVLGLLADMDKNRIRIFRALTVLRQLSLDPALVDADHAGLATSAKVTALVEQLTEVAAEGHRALVFSSFTGYLALVREALERAGIDHVYLDGRTRDRPARISSFREGRQPAFLISLKAGGVGLTLTEADYVFVLDPWWNPAAEAQAVDRTHRIGQHRPVHVYRLVSRGTIEEKVVALQDRKRRLFTTVVDSGEFATGTVTAEDIRGLVDG